MGHLTSIHRQKGRTSTFIKIGSLLEHLSTCNTFVPFSVFFATPHNLQLNRTYPHSKHIILRKINERQADENCFYCFYCLLRLSSIRLMSIGICRRAEDARKRAKRTNCPFRYLCVFYCVRLHSAHHTHTVLIHGPCSLFQ